MLCTRQGASLLGLKGPDTPVRDQEKWKGSALSIVKLWVKWNNKNRVFSAKLGFYFESCLHCEGEQFRVSTLLPIQRIAMSIVHDKPITALQRSAMCRFYF